MKAQIAFNKIVIVELSVASTQKYVGANGFDRLTENNQLIN